MERIAVSDEREYNALRAEEVSVTRCQAAVSCLAAASIVTKATPTEETTISAVVQALL